MTSNKSQTITIVGAGLVGSLLGVMLGQRGYRVKIFERRSDMRNAEVESGRSINLALSERGIFALKMAGLMEQVEKLLIPMRGRMLHSVEGETDFSAYGQRENEVIYSVSRGDLNSLMMTAAEEHPDVELFFDQKTTDVDFENNVLKLENESNGTESTETFQIVIGADGAGSRVRRALIPRSNGESVSEFLDHDYKELEIPAGPKGEHQIDRESLHIWPRGGYMLIALPNQNGSFTVTLFMPKKGNPSFELIDEEHELIALFEKQFPDVMRLIPNFAADYLGNPQGRLGTVRCSPWFFENDSLILGDASHAIVPFHGQGMNSGFEDCSELIRLLDEYEDDWEKVLPEFDRIRRPNAEAIADMAIENYVTMRDSVNDPKYHLKKELGFRLELEYPSRFIPRYSMVMFHRIPYAEAFRRGEVQEEILNVLVEAKSNLDDVDFDLAKTMIFEGLSELP